VKIRARKDGLSFVERSTELRGLAIVSGMREMVKADGQVLVFESGNKSTSFWKI